jgi:hypothetical protein
MKRKFRHLFTEEQSSEFNLNPLPKIGNRLNTIDWLGNINPSFIG